MKKKAGKLNTHGSSYAQFGLDAVKKARDASEASKLFYDPWRFELVGGRHVYLCFSNWVISRPTIDAFQRQQPVPALANDRCQKCNQPAPVMHYCIAGKEELYRELGICPDCVKWAAEYMSKPEPPPPPGTQLGLLDNGTRKRRKSKKVQQNVKSAKAAKPSKSPVQFKLF